MYSDEEILEHLTEGEGRGFLGRSMYDAIMEKIKQQENQLQQKENIIKEVREYIQDRYDGEVLTHTFDKDNVGELLEILDKGSDEK